MNLQAKLKAFLELEPLAHHALLPVTFAQAFYALTHERKNELAVKGSVSDELAEASEKLQAAASGLLVFGPAEATALNDVVVSGLKNAPAEPAFWAAILDALPSIKSPTAKFHSEWVSDSLSAARILQAKAKDLHFFSKEHTVGLTELETLETGLKAQVRALGGAIVARRLEPAKSSRTLKDEADPVRLSVRYLIAFENETSLSGWTKVDAKQI